MDFEDLKGVLKSEQKKLNKIKKKALKKKKKK